jgi:ABC-type multidrug transport system ATPase subunit
MWQGNAYVLLDTDSTKRIFHNGKPVQRLPLRGGEVVELGQGGPKLRFSLLAPAPPPAAAAAPAASGELSDVQVGGGRTYAMAGAAAILAQQLAARRNQARLMKEVQLRPGKPMKIGRLGNMDLTLDSIQVSKQHAQLELRQVAGKNEPVAVIVDLGSGNGTYVKGERITGECQIGPTDDVTIGPFLLHVEGTKLKIFDFRQASISCHGLTRQDPKTKRVFLDKVSLVIKPSEFVVFLGPSGSGKSTLLKTLTGADHPQGGKVLINDVDFFANYQRLKQSVGYVPQEDIVHAELSVRRTLEYAAELRLPKELDEAGRKKRIDEVLSILELTVHQHKPVFKLSGGQKKRVSIGVELLTEPSMLYLDEPTSGLDANLEGKMMLLFRELSLRGNTVVCVTHHLDNVHLADKVGIMFDGKLAFYGAPDEALEHFKCKRMAEIFERLGESQDAEALRNEYLGSEYYARHLAAEVMLLDLSEKDKKDTKKKDDEKFTPQGAGFFGQFSILSRRYLEILTRDLRNTLILVAQAPIVAGVICIAIPTNFLVRSPTNTLLLVLCLSALWFGTSNAAREITKEASIFKRERMVSLQVVPYVASKFFVLQLFSLIQCVLMQMIVFRFADTPAIRFVGTNGSSWLLSLANLYLLSLSGIGLGLLISAFAGNSDKAMSLVPIVLIPQILLSGGFGLFRQGSKVRPVAYATSLNWALDNHKRIALCPLGEKARCFACLTPTDPDIEEADPEQLPKQLKAIKEELPTRCIADGQRTKSETTEIVMTGFYGPYIVAADGQPRTKVRPKNGFIVLGGMSVLFFVGVSIALRVKSD